MNGWCSVRKARPWFDKLTTNGLYFKGYNKKEYALLFCDCFLRDFLNHPLDPGYIFQFAFSRFYF